MSDDTHNDKPDNTAIIDLMIDTLVTIYEMEAGSGSFGSSWKTSRSDCFEHLSKRRQLKFAGQCLAIGFGLYMLFGGLPPRNCSLPGHLNNENACMLQASEACASFAACSFSVPI